MIHADTHKKHAVCTQTHARPRAYACRLPERYYEEDGSAIAPWITADVGVRQRQRTKAKWKAQGGIGRKNNIYIYRARDNRGGRRGGYSCTWPERRGAGRYKAGASGRICKRRWSERRGGQATAAAVERGRERHTERQWDVQIQREREHKSGKHKVWNWRRERRWEEEGR